ncbi:hypothetical protein ABIA39_001417 [Nocardia sp. GAS34]|uniref:hypothetical protein n=1 Tax=unclassified Nocardia TaxID=2637762 RepID=UPI003D1BEAEB
MRIALAVLPPLRRSRRPDRSRRSGAEFAAPQLMSLRATDVQQLVTDVAEALPPGGSFVVTYRDT